MACRRIEAGWRNITELSALCGFNDVSYFIRIFKKTVGITPKQYLLNNEKNNIIIPNSPLPNGMAKKRTPAIDAANKDPAYIQSFTFNIFDQEKAKRGSALWATHGKTENLTDAKISFLWDEEYLYAFVEVVLWEDTVQNIGEDYILKQNNPWKSNCIELFLLWDDFNDIENKYLKLSVEPLYNREWGCGCMYDDIAPKSKATATLTDEGYNAEYKIAIPPKFLKEGRQIKVALQVNHFDGEGSVIIGRQIFGSAESLPTFTLGSAI